MVGRWGPSPLQLGLVKIPDFLNPRKGSSLPWRLAVRLVRDPPRVGEGARECGARQPSPMAASTLSFLQAGGRAHVAGGLSRTPQACPIQSGGARGLRGAVRALRANAHGPRLFRKLGRLFALRSGSIFKKARNGLSKTQPSETSQSLANQSKTF